MTGEPAPAGARGDLVGLVARTEGLQPWRRVFHATSGAAAALGPGLLDLSRVTVVALLATLLIVAVLIDLLRLRVPSVNRIFFRLLPALASPREAFRPASSTWYVLSLLVVWAIFPATVAVPAILILALADPAASVVGRLFGRRRLGKGTLLGATTFFLVSVIVLVTFLGWAPASLARAAAVALAVTTAEVLPVGVDDNLMVPLTAAAFLVLLSP